MLRRNVQRVSRLDGVFGGIYILFVELGGNDGRQGKPKPILYLVMNIYMLYVCLYVSVW